MVSFRVLVAFLVVASVVLLDATSAQPWGDFEAIVQSYARYVDHNHRHSYELCVGRHDFSFSFFLS